MKKIQYFQDFVYALCHYWMNQGCLWSQPYDEPMGAGTFHPHTFFKALGPEPWSCVYIQPCRRPIDGRYGKSPNRLQYYYQLQVFIKPTPANILDVYLKSLEHVGIVLKQNDVALYEDNWKGPTLGAWGLGWEVRANGEEITQFTYFQEFGGLSLEQISCEITYGLERLFMYANGYQNIMDIPYNKNFTYGDIYFQNEFEFSNYNFKFADVKFLFQHFEILEQKVAELCNQKLSLPAYDYVLQASHTFNLLDARGALSVTERQRFLGRVRDCAKKCAIVYSEDRKEKNYPFLNKLEKLDSASKPRNDNMTVSSRSQALSSRGLTARSKIGLKKSKNVQLVLEIGVEEMPPDFQTSALKTLQSATHECKTKLLEKYAYDDSFCNDLSLMQINVFISARRIAFVCSHVPSQIPAQHIEIWGPAESIAKDSQGNITQAGIGFCKKNGLSEKDVSYKAKNAATRFLYAQKTLPPCDLPTVIVNEFKNKIYSLDAPLKMSWNSSVSSENFPSFVRPVRWILCLVENKILPIEMFGLQSSNITYGQRVLSPKPMLIKNAKDYEKSLKKLFVVHDSQTRKEIILKQACTLLKKMDEQAELFPDNALLEKCAGMTESPHVFLGKFKSEYLKLPPKLIVSVLKEHMNYFHVQNSNTQKLMPYYIGVANYKCQNMQSMIAGTQKVVTSRLEDGAFYFENDLLVPFQSLREKLNSQVFQESLGTLYEKSERLAVFVQYVAHLINSKKSFSFSNEEIEILAEAGRNCKNDLKTGCVQEFPDEMQGVMGGVLVRAQNAFHNVQKSECVAEAIEEHYYPIHAFAPLPRTKWAHMLSLADKLDSLILFISAGYEPKGHSDPFGLRRLAISIARLLNWKNEPSQNHNLEISCSFEELLDVWKTHCATQTKWKPENIQNFFVDRVKSLLKENFNPNSVESVSRLIAKKPLNIFVPLLTALEKHFVNAESLIPYKRARSITQNVEEGHFNPSLFSSEAEQKLYSTFLSVQKNASQLFQNGHFELFFKELDHMTEPLAKFFDSVLVNDPNSDIRQNRLQLLFQIRKLYEDTLDLSVVQATHHK